MLSAQSSQVSDDKLYVDDVFQAYTYIGNGSTQTINNGIDLAGKGGMVWIKGRSSAYSHTLTDTSRGVRAEIYSDATSGQVIASPGGVSAFNSNGFSIESRSIQNLNAATYVSWTFRKAPKFFDVVTWTGNDEASARTIPHSLGVAPGMVMIKCTSSAGEWCVYHRGDASPNSHSLFLNTTAASTPATYLPSYFPATYFNPSGLTTWPWVNSPGQTYVAYLFAHDTSTDGLIQCGSFTGTGGGVVPVSLGWELQYLLIKNVSSADNWRVVDSIRGFTVGLDNQIYPNTADVESGLITDYFNPTATGFTTNIPTTSTYIYMAIRRPNKPPTVGTQVYNAIAYTGDNTTSRNLTGLGFVPDWSHIYQRSGGNFHVVNDRLRGAITVSLDTSSTGAEGDIANTFTAWLQDGVTIAKAASGTGTGSTNNNALTYIAHFLKRAPGVFDVVCYTGTGVAHTEPHGLGVVPELVIVKCRTQAQDWYIRHGDLPGKYIYLTTAAASTLSASSGFGDNVTALAPTASVFYIGGGGVVNNAPEKYVAYLFATKAGISKVGSYIGNGSSQNINCGFTTGARFALIKRTDNLGDWFVWDTTRGIVAGTDPHLSLNTTAAEVTSDDSIDPDTSGFIVNHNGTTGINENLSTYIYLAFA